MSEPERQVYTVPVKELVSSTATDNKDEIKRLRTKHPIYSVFEDGWKISADFYDGGKRVITAGYIAKHHREDQTSYTERIVRADYENYTALVVDFFTNFLFSEPISRDGGKNKEFFSEFEKNVDKRGHDINHFMRRVSTRNQLYGMCYVLVESPKRPPANGPLTKLQEEELGLRPYWVLINPDEVLDWDIDEFGVYTYIKRCQKLFGRDKDFKLRKIERYTEWKRDIVTITDIDITERRQFISNTEKLPNELGEIPIVAVPYQECIEYPHMGVSFVKDIVLLNRSVLNYSSLINEFLYRQCFNILGIQTSGALPLESEGSDEIGTSNVWEYPVGAEKPAYITPPIDPAEFLQSERDKKRKAIFEIASQNLSSEFSNGEKSSGFSQTQSFAKTVPFIAQRADALETAETKLMSLTLRYKHKEWNGSIKYKDRYEQTNVMDAITQLRSMFKDVAIPSETFVKASLKRLVREVDGKLSREDMDKIVSEIESMNFTEWQGKIMQSKASPADQHKPKSSGTLAEVKAEAKVPNTKPTRKLVE